MSPLEQQETGAGEHDEPAAGRMLNGRCRCGAVRYVVDDAFEYAMNCHCSACRASTGAAYKPIAGIVREKLLVTQGAERLVSFGEQLKNDQRCDECGSYLFSVVREGRYVHVWMGTLIDEPTLRPTHHIFVGSKARWHQITDDLPQYLEYRT